MILINYVNCNVQKGVLFETLYLGSKYILKQTYCDGFATGLQKLVKQLNFCNVISNWLNILNNSETLSYNK